jgi:hypothetical protein
MTTSDKKDGSREPSGVGHPPRRMSSMQVAQFQTISRSCPLNSTPAWRWVTTIAEPVVPSLL